MLSEKEFMRKLSVRQRILANKSSSKVALISIIYGLWLLFNQNVLSKYLIYELMKDYINSYLIAMTFIIIGLTLVVGIISNARVVKNISTVLMTVTWSTWAISFFITPPPNSVWVFSGFVACLSYEALWADTI